MIFLLDYDRPSGRLVSLRTFQDVDRVSAQQARLELELELNRLGIEREVVLLEATSEAAIRRTHRRYFETLAELAATKID